MENKKRTPAGAVALGGVLAALAVVIMAMGTLIPVATYVCPMLCILLLQVILKTCSSRIAWAWYEAVSVLSLLLAPDKEAAIVFVFLGYYPIVKPRLDRSRGKWLWKGLLFNGAVLAAYGCCCVSRMEARQGISGAGFRDVRGMLVLGI